MELDPKTKSFLLWIDDPKCPFNHCFNGIDADRPRIEYEKGNKHYSIDEVYNFWDENIFADNK